MSSALELLRMWRGMVDEHEDGVPRYTILPGAALNMLVTWTDSFLSSQNTRDGGTANNLPPTDQ